MEKKSYKIKMIKIDFVRNPQSHKWDSSLIKGAKNRGKIKKVPLPLLQKWDKDRGKIEKYVTASLT